MKRILVVPLILAAVAAGAATRLIQDQCGPFMDVSPQFCPYVLEAYYTGITAGTSATTFSPDVPITRGQAAVFVTKGLNQALARGSRRAALGQWWTPQNEAALGLTGGFTIPASVQSDGTDVWVADVTGFVWRVRGSDGRILESWTISDGGLSLLAIAAGKVFITGSGGSGNNVYVLDPQQPPGELTPTYQVGMYPGGIAFDGARLWTANYSGSVSIIDLATGGVTTVTAGFQHPKGLVFDGQNMWITDNNQFTFQRLDANAAIVQTVDIGGVGGYPIFDGHNIWVPAWHNVQLVDPSTGLIVATLTTPNMDAAYAAAFDGQRVLVTNGSGQNGRIFLFNAANLSLMSDFPMPHTPTFACSDGLNFWLTQPNDGFLVRF